MTADLRVRVQSLDTSISDAIGQNADLFIGALGYESRSMYLPCLIGDTARRIVVVAFDVKNELAFEENWSIAQKAGFDIRVVQKGEYGSLIQDVAQEVVTSARPGWNPRVVVDISSMTRVRIARTLVQLRAILPAGSTIDVLYAPAAFDDEAGDDGPVTESGPLPHFAGWSGTPDIELGMIIGLGFESHLALGVVESHEPADVWCFVPKGVDDRYDDKVQRDNKLLFDMVPDERRLDYDVMQPFACAEAIQGILRATLSSHRMMVVPLGAKAFCLSALTVALAYEGRLNIWRVSSGLNRTAKDRVALGPVCGMRLRLEQVPSRDWLTAQTPDGFEPAEV